MSVWKELNPPVYPEGDYVAVFCSKCGGKNRQDEGWRYKDDPLQRARHQAAIHSMGSGFTMMIASLGAPARLFYECEYCRDDDKRVSPDEDCDDVAPVAPKKGSKSKAKPAAMAKTVTNRSFVEKMAMKKETGV